MTANKANQTLKATSVHIGMATYFHVTIEQTQLIDEIKWFVYLLNLIIFTFHTNMTYQLLE